MWTGIKWFYNGYFNYGKSGFLKNQKDFNPEDLNQDIDNKNFLITGANSGIGFSTSLELAKRGGNVYMICRNKERGENALNEIKGLINSKQEENDKVHLIQCDVSKLSDCKKLVEHFKSNEIPIDVLVHNAGVMLDERKTTSEDIEMTFATNLLGPFYITYLLTDYLTDQYKQSKENHKNKPRVIFVTSGGMLTQKMSSDYQFEHLKKWDPLSTYSVTKRAMVYLTELFSKRNSSDINYYSMHPGWSSTPQLESAMPMFNNITKGMQRTSEQGADTIVWLSISPTVENNSSGLFFQDRKPVLKYIPHSNTESTPEEVQNLWDYLYSFVNK